MVRSDYKLVFGEPFSNFSVGSASFALIFVAFSEPKRHDLPACILRITSNLKVVFDAV